MMIGVDVSKGTLSTALVLDARSVRAVWEKDFPNVAQGIERLLQLTPPGTPWVVEPTGRYSLQVAIGARAAGQEVLLAPARKAKRFLESLQSRAKTDRLDGFGLARFGFSRPLDPYPIKSEPVEQLDQLLSARRGLSQALMSLRQKQNELPYAREALSACIETLSSEIDTLDRKLAQHIKSSEAFAAAEKIDEVQGIGPVTAAAVTSRLAAKQFDHPDKFVAYIGLDIGVVQSGKRKGNRGLTKQGDAEIRRLLYVCAQANLRCKVSPFKDQFERECAKGLSKTAALNAVARKLAKVCWSLHRHGTSYDPARVNTQPKKEQSTSDQAEQTEFKA
jgi:transposase